MRIVHFDNVAGVSTTLAKYQRKRGHRVSVLVREHHEYGYPGETLYESNLARTRHALTEVFLTNIAHYHDGPYLYRSSRWRSFVLEKLDYRLAKIMLKNVVFHFHGSSVRDPEARKKSSSYFKEKLIVAMPDLLPFLPSHAVWVPHPVDTDIFYPIRGTKNASTRVGFYEPPSKQGRLINTPERTRETIGDLRNLHVEPFPAYKIQWTRMPAYYNSIGIWVDKMNINFYGLSACEAAACGVPVIARIGERERTLVPDCPFIPANYANLSNAIEYLSEENTRKYVGQRCLDFVKRVHAASRVCEVVSDVYYSH